MFVLLRTLTPNRPKSGVDAGSGQGLPGGAELDVWSVERRLDVAVHYRGLSNRTFGQTLPEGRLISLPDRKAVGAC